MRETRQSELVTGLFIVLAAAVFALFAFKVGRFDLMGLLAGEAVECRAYFLDVKTLRAGSKVKVGGRDVGEVTGVHLVEAPWPARPGSGAAPRALHRLVDEVTFELTYRELRLDLETARVSIAQESLLSPHFLRLDPGQWPQDRPPEPIFDANLPAGTVLASTEGAGIDELMAVARPAVEELTAILRTLNRELLTPTNVEAVRRVIGALDQTLAEGTQLAETLNRGLLAPDNVEALDRMIHSLDEAAADGQAVAARLDELLDPERDPRFERILTELAAATGDLRTNFVAVSEDLQDLLARADQVLGNADRMLGETETELAEASRRLQRALWQGEMALRKIRGNPSTLFFGDDETDLEAQDFDLTETRLRGRARPYGQRDERDR